MDSVLEKSNDICLTHNLVLDYSHNTSSVFTHDSQYFYISNSSIFKVSTQTMTIESKINTNLKEITFLTLSPNGTYLSAVSSDSECIILEIACHSVIFSLPANLFDIQSVCFLSNSNQFLVAQVELFIHLYDIRTHYMLKTIKYSDVITKVLASINDKVFIVGAYILSIYDVDTKQQQNIKCERELFVLSKAVEDSIYLAGDEFGGIWQYIPETNYFGKLSEISHASWVSIITIALNNKIAASGGLCSNILVWNLENKSLIATFYRGKSYYARFLLICGKSKNVISEYEFRSVSVWNIETGQQNIIGSHGDVIVSGDMTPDYKRFITLSSDAIFVWDAEKFCLIRAVSGHTKRVKCILDNDSDRIVSAGDDDCIKIWDVKKKTDMITVKGCAGVNKMIYYKEKYIVATSGIIGFILLLV